MLEITPQELAKNPDILLARRMHDGQPIDCGYSGKVGALFQGGKYFILSPNMEYIPEPADNDRMRFKYDGRLGDDDPLLWPQPYVEAVCHFPAIMRNACDTASNKTNTILYKPYEDEIFMPISSGTLSGLGVLDNKIVRQFKDCLEFAKQLHKNAEEDPKCARTALGAQLIATATHGIGHLERLPMLRKQQKFIFYQLQRCMMELLALIQYISVLQPLMNSPDIDTNHVKKPCDAVGAFFVNPNDAHLFWKAGIPVWLVCLASKAGVYRIDRLVDTIKGRDVLVVEDDTRDHSGVYYTGSSHGNQKYNFFTEYTRHYLSGSNPFNVTATSFSFGSVEGKLPGSMSRASLAVTSSSDPSKAAPRVVSAPVMTTALASTSSSVPLKCPLPAVSAQVANGVVRSNRGKASNRSQPYTKPKRATAPGSSGRNKYVDMTGPLAPPPIPTWTSALLAVDTSPDNRVPLFMDAKNGYAFPDPGLFLNVQTEAKMALYFANWVKHRTSLIFRISIPRTNPAPISNQLWRTLLNMHLVDSSDITDVTTQESKSAKRKQAVSEILINCLKAGEDDVLINPRNDELIFWKGTELRAEAVPPVEVAHQILWELSELNFRCKLLALDRRAHNNTLSATTSNVSDPTIPSPAPLTCEDLLFRCFLGSSMVDVQQEHANHGLASPRWSDRRTYLIALYNVMLSWTGFESYALSKSSKDLLDLLRKSPDLHQLSEESTQRLEVLLAGFYTQAFFNFFGRAAIIPRRL